MSSSQPASMPEKCLATKPPRKSSRGASSAKAFPVGKKPRLYEILLSALRSEILLGTYPAETALPSEQALMERFEVSRHTVRDALRRLRDLGLVKSQQGRGTVVVDARAARPYIHQVNSIGELHDVNVESRYNDHAVRVAPSAALLQRLDVEPEDGWLRIDGMRYDKSSGIPICCVEIFIPARLAGINRHLKDRTGSIYSLIEEVYGETVTDVQQEFRAVSSGQSIAKALRVVPGSTVVEIKRIYRILDGRVAEVTFNYYTAGNFRFSMHLRRVGSEKPTP